MAAITTQQIVSFIQNKIAETHAAGEDVVNLLANPEIAFSLQVLDSSYVLDSTYKEVMQAPENTVTEDNKNIGMEQLIVTADVNTNNGASREAQANF